MKLIPRFKTTLSMALMSFKLCPWLSLGMILLAAASSPLAALVTKYTGILVDTVITWSPLGEFEPILCMLFVILGLGAVGFLVSYLSSIIGNRIDEALNLRITEDTLHISGRIDFLRFISKEHRDAQAAYADSALGVFIALGTNSAVSLIQGGVAFVAYSVLIYDVAGISAVLVGSMVTILSGFINTRAQLVRNKLRDNTRQEERRMKYIDDLYTDAPSFFELTLFGFLSRLQIIFTEAFSSYTKKKYVSERRIAKYNILFELISAVLTVAATLSFFALGNITSAGQMTVIFAAFAGLLGAGRGLGSSFSFVTQMFERVKQYNEYRAKYELPELDGCAQPRVLGSPAVDLHGVSFAYNGRKILDNISFSIYSGQIVAIVGENGAGKTTLANIILGLFPCEGIANTFGRSAYEARRYGEVDSVAVLQKFGQYKAMTLGENIRFGETVNSAVNEDIDDFFYDKDYFQIIGEQFGGVNYSGGEWQKIALARCANSDADIMILDEPTAALDPIAEASVFKRFMEVNRNKTRILITHRLGAVRNADIIFVLKDKRIYECGTHDELMQLEGYYAEMFHAQAQWYVHEVKNEKGF